MTERRDHEDGSGTVLACFALAVVALVLVLVVDLTAYLVANARAQTAADAAALAAVVAADPSGAVGRDPRSVAVEVAEANGATLVSCDCGRGAREVALTVSVEVRAIAVHRLADRRVEATARAHLVHDAPVGTPGGGPSASP
ncbi:MAG: pilus assembly protein TadG-related protein [Actinobacteria bacterium]|nr:pilus assembly protein TadG-related protein [Actinomycetota bacterium]